MAGPHVPAEKLARLRAEYAVHGNKTAAALNAGVSRNYAIRVLTDDDARSAGLSVDEDAATEGDGPTHLTIKEQGDDAEARYVASRLIRTAEDALDYAEIDRTVWTVASMEVTAWQVGMKVKADDGSDTPIVQQLWRVALKLKRIIPKPYGDAMSLLFDRMKGHEPKYPRMRSVKPPADPHLLEVDLFDVHFGKLCWAPETGQNYDLRIAEKVYRHAVEDLASNAAGRNIDRILLPIGNDFLNADGPNNETTAGTPQDIDGRFPKIIAAAQKAVIDAVEYLLNIAPVDVIWVPGNHDRVASYMLARIIAAWFRSTPDVTVDHSPTLRKYVTYGATLIGFTHGDQEKASDLPVIMATERREEWAATNFHEWRCGHVHKAKRAQTVSMDTHQGVEIRWLRALTGTDAWHAQRGYVGTRRAAECYLTSKANGYAGHFIANVRE